MRNKFLGITFLIIVFVIGVANLSNGLHAVKPLVNKYIFQKEEVNEGESITAAIDNVEDAYNENFKYKEKFINMHGLLRKAIGNREVNGVIKLDNGMLIGVDDKEDVSKNSDSIRQLNEYLSNKDIEFIYIAAPSKVNEYDKQLPEGRYDHGNENQNELLKDLKNEGVATFDLRKELHKETDDWYSAFFSTDHHWKPETGFWAYTVIASELNRRFGYRLDEQSMDISNYKIKTYKDYFLGKQGERVGKFYAGVDDISVIMPKTDTNMSFEVPSYNVKREGRFENVFFDYSNLGRNSFDIYNYYIYIGFDYPLCIQKNANAENDKKLLVLRDSFALTEQAYFSFMFNEVDVVDLRCFTDKTLKEYIDETLPDVVFMQYTPSMLIHYPKAFEFGL